MLPAASRFMVAGAVTSFVIACAPPAALAAERATPSRPAAVAPNAAAPLPSKKFGGVEYLSVADVAARLGLKFVWLVRGRKAALIGSMGRAELEADKREIFVNGLRVFLGNAVIGFAGQLFVSRIDSDCSLGPTLRPGFGIALLPPPKIIALDAGHGGKDEGMKNERLGLKEKVLTLDVVLRLKKILEAVGYQVVLTRADDRALAPEKKKDLPMRAGLANRAGADLFVSVHFNSLYPDTKTSGTEIYVYAPQHQRSTSAWSIGAADDTRTDPVAVNRFDPWSALLAHHMHQEVVAKLKTADRGRKTMHLLALQDLKCPAVLVEAVFLSNDFEARRAATPEYRQKMAEALAAGIRAYAATLGGLRLKM